MTSTPIFAAQAKVTTRATTDELLARARESGVDVPDEELVFWSAEITNTRLDTWFTRMGVSSLRNYAEDAKNGVSFQNSHRTDDIGIGYSLDATFNDEDPNNPHVIADFYTVTGIEDTDRFIRKMRAKIARDVSIGFYGGQWVCDICGNDMMRSMDCWHIPGFTYEVEENGAKRQVTATATIEDARLSEVSVVYDGATPGAVIKGIRELEAGRLTQQGARALESQYRIKLPPITGVDMSQKREATTAATDTAVAETPEPQVEATEAEVTEAREVLELEEGQRVNLSSLLRLARDGKTYRTDLIADALKEGVRAHGTEFNKERYERTLQGSDIETIKLMRDDWQRSAAKVFTGGRHTEDDASEQAPQRATTIPAAAFGG